MSLVLMLSRLNYLRYVSFKTERFIFKTKKYLYSRGIQKHNYISFFPYEIAMYNLFNLNCTLVSLRSAFICSWCKIIFFYCIVYLTFDTFLLMTEFILIGIPWYADNSVTNSICWTVVQSRVFSYHFLEKPCILITRTYYTPHDAYVTSIAFSLMFEPHTKISKSSFAIVLGKSHLECFNRSLFSLRSFAVFTISAIVFKMLLAIIAVTVRDNMRLSYYLYK